MRNPIAYFIPFILIIILLASCYSNRQVTTPAFSVGDTTGKRSVPPVDPLTRKLIDSILQAGLDTEALYTMFAGIKPMSSLVSFTYPLADTANAKQQSGNILDKDHQPYLDSLYAIQQALNTLDLPDLKFVLTPYRRTYNGNRHIQINVIRISLLDSLLRAEQNFFGHFGLVPAADPGVVLNTIEYEETYKRWRGYGYLFGYPPYAVDFFVEAGYETDISGQFVARDFFAIPVHVRQDGHFVYATPKGYLPRRDPDSVLYFRALSALNEYRALRSHYLNADSSLQAYRLLSDFLSDHR